MSTEAEKYLNQNSKNQFFIKVMDSLLRSERNVILIEMESYHQHRLSQILSELTDEKIEEIIEKKYVEPTESPFDPWNKLWLREGAKAIREFIKGKQ